MAVLVLYAVLLLAVRRPILDRTLNRFVRSLAFLHGDYRPSCYYWELIELTRRTVLTGWLILIGENDAFIRILVAMLISLAALVLTLIVQPYIYQSDHFLAVAAQVALVVSFSGTSYIKAYDETAHRAAATSNPNLAADVYNFDSSNGLVDMLLCFLLGMLAILIGRSVQMVLKGALEPTVRLSSTGLEPELSLTALCTYHGFISHGRRVPRPGISSLLGVSAF